MRTSFRKIGGFEQPRFPEAFECDGEVLKLRHITCKGNGNAQLGVTISPGAAHSENVQT